MPTVSEVLRGVSAGFIALGGIVGLGREVRRVIHVRASDDLIAPIGSGDLVVFGANSNSFQREPPERVLKSLLGAGVVGVLTDLEPSAAALQAAAEVGTPLLATGDCVDIKELHAALIRSLELSQSHLDHERTDVQREFTNLVRAGALRGMVLQRLVEISGKAVALHGQHLRVEHTLHAALQGLHPATFDRAVEASDGEVQRWLVGTADSTVNNILYVELATGQLVRLFAPIWVNGQFAGGVSLVGQSDQMTGRDRIALLAAVRVLTAVSDRTLVEPPSAAAGRRSLVLAMRAPAIDLDRVAAVAQRVFARHEPLVVVADSHITVRVPDDGCEPWQRRRKLIGWQTALAAELGPVSIGYADCCAGTSAALQRSVVWAAEAAFEGDHLYGPGHLTSYADAQLAKFLAGARGGAELRTLYERVIGRIAQEDPKRERGLVETLDVYCEVVSMAGTAERLNVHRNTVLYRLKHIQELTSLDLNDGASRLLLQLGVVAGRFAHEARRHVSGGDVPESLAHLLGAGPVAQWPRPGLA